METSSTWSDRVTARIRRAIKESGYTEEYVGLEAGIPNATMSRCLNGHSWFKLKQVENIARVLQVSPELFLDSREGISS